MHTRNESPNRTIGVKGKKGFGGSKKIVKIHNVEES